MDFHDAKTKPMLITETKVKEITWEEIKFAVSFGNLKNTLDSGTVIPLSLSNGDKVDLIVGYDKNDKPYFIFDKLMSDEHVMNESALTSNVYGYSTSDMAYYADNEVFRMLPDFLQKMIEETTVVECLNGRRIVSKHKLFCLSYTQVFGEVEWPRNQEPEDTQIDIFNNPRNRIKMKCNRDYSSSWWLRSASGNYGFSSVLSSGTGSGADADISYGVALGFCL